MRKIVNDIRLERGHNVKNTKGFEIVIVEPTSNILIPVSTHSVHTLTQIN